MLSAPVKSARRISSLLNLGSNRDSRSLKPQQKDSPDLSAQPSGRARSSSRPARHASAPQPNSTESRPKTSSGPIDPLDLNDPLPPPPSLLAVNKALSEGGDSRPGSRDSSPALAPPSRPGTPGESHPRLSKRKSWMPGKLRSPSSMDVRVHEYEAWVAGLDQKIPYDLGPLSRGEVITELWNEQGDTFVYLFPQATRRPPSFKVDSTIFADSPSLTYLARGTDPKMEAMRQSTRTLTITDSDANTYAEHQWADNDGASSGSGRMALVEEPREELHLYLPIPLNSDVSSPQCQLSPEDAETLLLFRNLFAFLLGQALIATPRYPTLLSILMEVAALLRRFEFSNLDGSTFGEVATSSFANYCDELHLGDVRKSREKTIEAIVLGEQLRYYPLYLEGFVHGVGKMDDLKRLRSSTFELISPVTRKRLERGYIDLENRLKVMRAKLEEFEFPSLFSGIANSNTAAESKTVRFKAWKASFFAFRKFIMSYYRQKYGSWPPKAGSKKNEFEESGLNRLLLKEVYEDFASLYDMLVDRTLLTTRTTDMASEDLEAEDPMESVIRALRRMMSEYDRSTPPVLPPIPFDIPQIPSLSSLHRKPMDPKKEAKERQKKLKDADINEVLMGSYTQESMKSTPFIQSFMQFERRSAHGKNIEEIADNRCGQWLFLYAVIQTLPLLVVDAPDLRHTEGVEYFLCVAPRGGAPWVQNDPKSGRSWFGVAGGTGVVSLPSDVVTSSVDGIYRRSHCWQVATQWAEKGQLLGSPITNDDAASLFSAPTPAPQSSVGSMSDIQGPASLISGGVSPVPRTGSPGLFQSNRMSIHPGLEALPLPAGVMPVEPPTKQFVRHNPNMSFDDILKGIPNGKKK
ncbi:hypothetical protein VTN77DRAFT_9721 [Rasamsonia byssochlamydoides]|uniref:uncharacterized protein n=1 Tax=Rasamsonia byssochlamydoides TaxID=89139 RepID=UPI00374227E1